MRHSLGQPHEVVVEALDVSRLHPQDGVGVLADLSERDATTRLSLSVELFLLELLAFVFIFRAHAALSRHAASLVLVNTVSVPQVGDAATYWVR